MSRRRSSRGNPELTSRSGQGKKPKRRPADEVAEESRSREVTVAADMVFSQTKHLSGVSIGNL